MTSQAPSLLTVDDAHAAIAALYGADAHARERANDALVSLGASSHAWSVALALLEQSRADSRVVFFASNMLVGKIRDGAFERALDATGKMEVIERLRATFAALARDSTCELGAKRLGIALASAAVRCDASVVISVVECAIGVASSAGMDDAAMRVGVETLACVAEDVDDAESSRRRALSMTCAAQTERVLHFVRDVFAALGTERSNERDALKTSCVRAAHMWLKLDPSGDVSGGLCVSPTQLLVAHSALFSHVVACLAIETAGCGAAAVDMLVELHQGRSGSEQEEFEAMNAVTRGLLAHGAEASAPNALDLARNITLVAVSLSERCVNVLVRGDENSLKLVALVLSLMELHGREVSEVALDFFIMLATVGVSSRHASMGAPMYARLLEVMLKQSTLPDDFTTWDDAEEDADTFDRFREFVVADLFDNAYCVLRGQYLSIIASALSSAKNWQAAESGTFALRVAAEPISEELEESTSAANEAETFLAQMFSTIIEHTADNAGLFSCHALVRAETCEMIAAYSFWLGRKTATLEEHAALTRGILMYVTAAFPYELAWRQAANAFKNICARCARQLKDPSTFTALLEHTERCIASVRPNFDNPDERDERTNVMEGLARVIARMPIAQASQASARIIAPVITKCKLFATEVASTSAPAGPEASRAMAAELSLIASVVRFLEFSPNANVEHPAISVLGAAWPTLEEIARSPAWRATCVASSLSSIYIAALLSAKAKSVDMIVPMLESIARSFSATKEPCFLEPVSTAIEIASTSSSETGTSEIFPNAPHVGTALGAAFVQIVNEIAACALAHPSSAETWECADALFTTTRAFIIFAPAHGLANEALFTALDLAVQALELKEYGPVRSSLALLNALIAPGEKSKTSPPWVANAARVDEFLASRGARLVQTILVAASSGITPRVAIRSACTFLATLLEQAREVVTPWILEALARGNAQNAETTAAAAAAMARILTKPTPLNRARTISALCDYVLVVLGEYDVDDLLAYDL